MNKPKYVLTFEGVALDISKLVDSRETSITRQLCTTEFKSAVDTASFVIRYSPDELDLRASIMGFIHSSIETQKDIEVLITLDSYSLFKGYLDLSELKLSSKRLPELISLTANDVSAKLLDKIVDDYIFLEGQKISDIVKFLVTHAGGVFGSNEMLTSDDRVIPVFAIDRENDDDTYREYIDTLLFEAGGYVLDTDEDGWMNIIALPWESYEATRLIDDYQLDKGLETTRKIFDKNGLKVKWSTLKETDSNQRVWTSDFSRELEGKVLVGLDVPALGYYPEDGDITPTYQEFSADFLDREYLTKQKREKNKDLSIIAVRDVSASIVTLDSNRKVMKNEDAWEYPVLPSLKMAKNPTIYAKKAWYLLRNKTDQTVNLQLFTLEGRVLYRNKINYVTVPANADKLEEYTSTYIFTKEHAERFSCFYWHFLKNSSTIHKWSVLGDMSLGDVVQVSHKGSDVAQATLIVGATLKFVGNTSKVDCVGVALGPYNEYEVRSWGASESIRPQAPAGADGQTPISEYRYSESNIKPPIEKGMWLFAGKPMFFGSATLNDVNQGQWMVDPRPVPGKPYRWMRVSVDGGKTYQYSCITGKDGAAARDFSIQASALTYNMGSRGEVQTPVKIDLHIERVNCPNSLCEWTVQPAGIASALEGDSISLNIPVGFKSEYVKVSATLPGVGERKLAICGVLESLPEASYLGIYPQNDEFGNLIIYPDRAPNGPLIPGDSIIWIYTVDEQGNKEPFLIKPGVTAKCFQISLRWNGSKFENLNVADDNYSDIMASHLADILKLPATVPSVSAAYGYFSHLAAQSAFIERLFANYIKVQKAIYGGGYSETGSPLGGKGFHLGANGQLQATDAILTGKFTCNVMETVLEAFNDGNISAHLTEGNGKKFKGYEVTRQINDMLPVLPSHNDNLWTAFCEIYDGKSMYYTVEVPKYSTSRSIGVYYAACPDGIIRAQTVFWSTIPQDKLAVITDNNGDAVYNHHFDVMKYESVSHNMVMTRFQYIGDFGYADMGDVLIPFTGTVRIKGNEITEDAYQSPLSNIREYSCTSSSNNIHYFKINDNIFSVYDSNMKQVCHFSEILSCDIEASYSSGTIGLRTQTIFPFDNVNDYSVGLGSNRFDRGYFNRIDAYQANLSGLPVGPDGLSTGDLYREGNTIKIK